MYDERHELCIQETLLREIDYPVCPKIEKTWFLLAHLVTTYHGGKKHLSEWTKSRSSRPDLFCQKGLLKAS